MRRIGIIPLLGLFVACTNQKMVSTVEKDRVDSTKISELYANALLKSDSNFYFRNEAKAIMLKNGSIKCRANLLFLEGKNYLYASKLDSVSYIADSGLRIPYTKADLGYKGKFYNLKGNVAGYRRNIYQSLDYYTKAEKVFLAVGDSNALAGIYSNMANTYFSLKDYSSALDYSSKAYALLDNVLEERIKTNIISIHAIALNKTANYKQALIVEKQADSIASRTNDLAARFAVTIGYAEIYKSAQQIDSAVKYYQLGIELGEKTGIKQFELVSRVGLLSIYEDTKRFDQIVQVADTIINLANELNNVDVLHTAKRIIGRAYAQTNDYPTAFQYLNESYNLYDATAGVENQKNINELRVKYQAEKSERAILKQQFLLAKQQTQLREWQLGIVLIVIVFAILVLVLLFKRRLSKANLERFELEKQQELTIALLKGEEQERTRIAFEIHDGIAAMVTGISYKLSAEEDSKLEVIELLKVLQDDSRKIAHNLMPIDFEKKQLKEVVTNLCASMSTPQIEIIAIVNQESLALNNQKSHLIYRIIQELINNALKHAACKTIFVKFEQTMNSLSVSIEDDGIGMPKLLIESGLKSLKERVRVLNGKLSIESIEQEGTTVKITVDL